MLRATPVTRASKKTRRRPVQWRWLSQGQGKVFTLQIVEVRRLRGAYSVLFPNQETPRLRPLVISSSKLSPSLHKTVSASYASTAGCLRMLGRVDLAISHSRASLPAAVRFSIPPSTDTTSLNRSQSVFSVYRIFLYPSHRGRMCHDGVHVAPWASTSGLSSPKPSVIHRITFASAHGSAFRPHHRTSLHPWIDRHSQAGSHRGLRQSMDRNELASTHHPFTTHRCSPAVSIVHELASTYAGQLVSSDHAFRSPTATSCSRHPS